MSHWQQQEYPPDPGITLPSQAIAAHTSSVLDGIMANTACLSGGENSRTSSPYLQALSYRSTYIWNRIKLLSQTAPTELLGIWFHVEDYERLLHDIMDVIGSNTMTEVEANNFICSMDDFIYEFERTMRNRESRSPRRSDSAPASSIFRDTGRIDISRSRFLMNTIDPGLSDHLKQIKYILIFIQATVLF